MFCRNCGAELKGGAKFCPKCGTPVAADPAGGNGAAGQSPASRIQQAKRPPYLAIGAIVIAVILVLLIIFGLRSCIGGGNYERPVKALVEGIEKQDGDKILSAFSDEMLDVMEDQSGYDRDEMADMMESMFSMAYIGADLDEENFKLDYKVTDDKDLSKGKIKDIEEEYKNQDMDIKIKDAKELEVELIAEIDGEEDTQEFSLTVVKIGGSWYLDPSSM